MAGKIFTFPERAEEVRKDFARLNLQINPFPIQGLASRDTPFVPYPKEVIKAINAFVTDAIGSRGYHGLAIIGDYGSGKTRLLFAMEKEISEGIVGCNSIYVDEPPADIQAFYEKTLDKTDFESILKGLSLRFGNFIESIMLKYLERVPSLLGEEKYFLKDSGIGLVEELSSFLTKEFGVTKVKEVMRAYAILLLDYFVSNIVHASRRMRVSLVNSVVAERGSAWQYISGNRISKELDKAMDFTDKIIKKIDVCGEVFEIFVNACKMAGNSFLFILVDEFEEIIEKKTNRQILDFLNDLRSLINNNVTSDFAMILSCTPEAWIKANQLSPGFSERFTGPAEMPPLDRDSAFRIVSSYLYSRRIKKTSKENIEPFEKESINYILKISNYKIREFIRNCNVVLAGLASSDKDIIDKSFVDKILKLPRS